MYWRVSCKFLCNQTQNAINHFDMLWDKYECRVIKYCFLKDWFQFNTI